MFFAVTASAERLDILYPIATTLTHWNNVVFCKLYDRLFLFTARASPVVLSLQKLPFSV